MSAIAPIARHCKCQGLHMLFARCLDVLFRGKQSPNTECLVSFEQPTTHPVRGKSHDYAGR